MPYDDPDPTDPMTLHGNAVETDNPDVQRDMAESFALEYLRMGYGRDRVLSMFRMPSYIGPYMAYEELGEAAIVEIIDGLASLWGGRRDQGIIGRDENGDVISASIKENTMNGNKIESETVSAGCGHHSAATTPKEQLMEEHRVIEVVLDAVERMVQTGSVDSDFLAKAIDFFRNFADGCHHAKEEDIFFPALESAGVPREGGPIGCMLHEHDQGRAYVGAMADGNEAAGDGDASARDRVLQAATGFIHLLREHIQKEDTVLFVMGDRVLDPAQQEVILSKFEQAENEEDPHKHGRYLALAEELSAWKFSGPSKVR